MSLKIILLTLLIPAFTLRPQAPTRAASAGDSTAARLMARLEASRFDAPWFTDIMRQRKGPENAARLDELADSLARRVVAVGAAPRGRSSGYENAMAALGTIARVGNRGDRKGAPYAGALDRLIYIHQHANVRTLRVIALDAMTAVPNRTRALAYLREVAVSEDSTADAAISALITDADGGSWFGPKPTTGEQAESRSILRGLLEQRRVTDRTAVEVLQAWAAHR
jgi:hypothetical protein